MGIESSASLLSTQIINIIHENNPDAKEARNIQKPNEINEPKLEEKKDKGSVFKETSINPSSEEKEAAPEIYNEHGYINQNTPGSDILNQKQGLVDIKV